MSRSTLTINDSQLYDTESFQDVDTWLRVVNGIVMALILSFSVVGNTTVLLLVAFHKKLQYRSVIVSMGLVIADLFVAVLWTVQSLLVTVIGEWPFDRLVCDIVGTFWLWILYSKWLESAVVSLDRFFIILFPFTYYKYSKPVLIFLTILAWLVPLLFVTPATILMDPYKFRLVVTTCTVDCLSGEHGETCFPYFAGLFSVFVSLGGLMPTVLYFIMYCISRRKRTAMKHRLGTQREGVQEERSSTVSISSGTTTTSSSTNSSNTSKASNGALKKWLKHRDQRALTTFFIVFLTLLVTQIPLIVLSGMRKEQEIYGKIPLWVHFIATYISLLSPALDPIVVMRNRDFRKVIARVINKHKTIPSITTKKKVLAFRRNSSISLPTTAVSRNHHRETLNQPHLTNSGVIRPLSVLSEYSINSLSQNEEPVEIVTVAVHHLVDSTDSPE